MNSASIVIKAKSAMRPYLTWLFIITGSGVSFWALWPELFLVTMEFTIGHMIMMTPLVLIGVLISAVINTSGISSKIQLACRANMLTSIVFGAALGAISPICGFCVIPLMAGLLAGGVPLAPVLAFWLSSPVIDPAMFTATVALLDFHFAIGKALSAFAVGVIGGCAIVLLSKTDWGSHPLRQGVVVKMLHLDPDNPWDFKFKFWKDKERWEHFKWELWIMSKLIFICMALAFLAEGLLQEVLDPGILSDFVGEEVWWAIPLATLFGSPPALDGYVILPITRSFIELGMSMGAAMSFAVAGSVISILGALAIFPVLNIRPFVLYIVVAIGSSMIVGWAYQIFV